MSNDEMDKSAEEYRRKTKAYRVKPLGGIADLRNIGTYPYWTNINFDRYCKMHGLEVVERTSTTAVVRASLQSYSGTDAGGRLLGEPYELFEVEFAQ